MIIFNPKNALTLLVLGAVGLVLAAFVLEYGFHVAPCKMCWWQRYAHWALATGGAVLWLLAQYRLGLVWMMALALVGVYLGSWQVLVQYKYIGAPDGCSSAEVDLANSAAALLAELGQHTGTVMPACDKVGFTIFGLTLATWNVLAMLGFLGFSITSLTMNKEK